MQIELLNEVLHGDEKNTSAKLLAEIQRLESIVTNTLNLSRPATVNKRLTSINQLITELLEIFSAQLEHRKITINTQLASDIPDIQVDPDLMKQVMINMLINASDALTVAGTIQISTRLNDDRSALAISIEDSGPGISKEQMEEIFSTKTSSKPTGLGLGLRICKEFVELHNGTIEITSSYLGGANFTIYLPLE
jgi:signal transduction histidine kinase